MKIYLRELSEQQSELDFNQENAWLVTAVEKVDEATEEEDSSRQLNALRPAAAQVKTVKSPRKVQAHFSINMVDEDEVVNGHIDTHVVLTCSRCEIPLQLNCTPSF